ncbi:MAG: phytanoyl-CoA dioxygenase family protein, partial [Alphaproteobacteria bacterium]
MTSLNIVAPDRDADSIAASIAEHGYVIIEELATELAAQAREELGGHIEAAPFAHTPFLGERTKRVGSILARSTAARELVIHPTVRALTDRILLPHCARYQLNFSGIMHLEPGAGAQSLHRDGVIYPVLHPCPPTQMATMWAISDFTVDNGGTQIAPGSHLWEHDRVPYDGEVVATAMPAGSVLIYTSGIYHGGGANTSNTVRTGMALQYSLGWLRQEENQYLANPPEVAQAYCEELRRLIGYDYGGPYLSFVNGDDPHRIFEDGYDGPGQRTTPAVDAAYARIEWLRLGDVKPVRTPSRE